jgi:hypothetical protein
MTNEDLLAELKQFIAATVSQEVAGLRVELKEDIKSLRDELKADIKGVRSDLQILDEKIDLVQNAIAETVTHHNDSTDTTLQDHEHRLRRLEHHAA